MKVRDIIELLIANKVLIHSVNGQLKLKSAKGALTPDLLELIKSNKTALIEYLAENDSASISSGAKSLCQVTRSKEGMYPLSFAQKRLWVVDQMQNGSANYNISSAMQVEGAFDHEIATQALQYLASRHEILRTIYVLDKNDEAKQHIQDHVDYSINIIDLSSLDLKQQNIEVQRRAVDDANKAFDLSCEPILRVTWLTLAKDKCALLFNMHHIASDGWSMNVLMQEFIHSYEQLSKGKSIELPELTLQYLDYSTWQSNYLQGDILKRQQAYWQKQLQGAPVVHSLPLDRPRQGNDKQPGKIHYSKLDREVWKRHRALARQHNVTPFMLVHAVFSLLLSRHSMATDIVIGTPIANRLHNELQNIIGYIANTLVLRTDSNAHESFLSFLGHVKTVNQDAHQYQDLPFELLVDSLQVARSALHAPLYQIMLSMDTNESSESKIANLNISHLEVNDVQAKHDITLEVLEGEQGLEFSWTYNTSLFDASTISQLAHNLNNLFVEIAATPSVALKDIQMLSDDSINHYVKTLNNTKGNYDYNKLMHQLVIEVVTEHEQNIAIIDDDGQMTYKELFVAAYLLSKKLRTFDLHKEELIAVLLPKGRGQVIACLAILMAGAAYLPLSVNWPAARCISVLERGNCRIIIGNDGHVAKEIVQKESQFTLLPVTHDTPQTIDDDEYQTLVNNFPYLQSVNDLAYVIFTSGSTGTPKGVAIEHKMAVNTLLDINQRYHVDHSDSVLAVSELSFDLSVYDIFGLLAVGGYVVFPSQSGATNPAHWYELINDKKISIWNTVPASAGLLADEYEQGSIKTNSTLKVIMMSGDWISPTLPDRLFSLFPNASVYSLGGATEGSIWSIHYPIESSTAHLKSVPYGKPLSNQSFYIIDEHQRLVPMGTIGELCIGGEGIARGYYGDSELTSKKFITHPKLGLRLYRTGDLGRHMSDGNIEFIGRVDDQVKIRGYRVELGDIEFCIESDDAIASCHVIAREDVPGIKRLVAYFQLVAGTHLDSELITSLQTTISKQLPEYMMPGAFICVEQWPLTANGKVDKKSLPRPELEELQQEFVSPINNIESQLLSIWAELLKIDETKLSVTANFFTLGGDSILSIQMVSRAAKKGLHFTVQDLFSAQTIRQLSLLVNKQSKAVMPQGEIVGQISLNPIQEDFFTDLTDWKHFNQSLLLKLNSPLSLDKLELMVEQLLMRHDALRSRFYPKGTHWQAEQLAMSDSLIRQVVSQVVWDEEELGSLTLAANSIQKSLDPEQGRMLKFVLFTGKNEDRLLMVIHHLVVDGVSWRIILDDLQLLQEQLFANEVLQLGAKTSSFQQWNQYLLEFSNSSTLEKERTYWQSMVTDDAFSFSPPTATSERNERVLKVDFTQDITDQLLTSCQDKYHAKINELLLSALQMAAYETNGAEKLFIELESHGRNALTEKLDVSQTVGWFTAMFPLLLTHPQESHCAEVIRHVKEQYRAIPNDGIGYGILKYLHETPIESHQRADILFNYLGQLDQATQSNTSISIANESMGKESSDQRISSHALTLTGFIEQGCLSFSIEFESHRFDAAEVQLFLNNFENAINVMVSDVEKNSKRALSSTDFPLAKITSKQLQTWQQKYDIEDIYIATGMQKGMLFHSMLEAGSYVTQINLGLNDIEPDSFKRAWQRLVNRHAIFRTAFVGLEEGELHQLVIKHTEMPWSEVDLTHLTSIEQKQDIQKRLLEDRLLGFEPDQAPLSRVYLCYKGSGAYEFIWSHHHALVDGWCLPIIFSELLHLYNQELGNRQGDLEKVTPFRDYAEWLTRQDEQQAREFWQEYVADIDAVTSIPLSGTHSSVVSSTTVKQSIGFTREETTQLVTLAKDHATTLNIVVQATWALLLSRYSNEKQVVFGTTTSGRPSDLPGVEEIVGLFINSLPAKITINEELNLTDWLKTIHQDQVQREQYSFIPLMDIQSYSNLDGALFNSLLVFENYPADEAIGDKVNHAGIKMQHMEYVEGTNYDLTITAYLEDQLALSFETARGVMRESELATLSQQFRQLLLNVVSFGQSPLSEIPLLSTDEVRYQTTELNQTVVDYPQETVVSQFKKIATQYPNNIALEFEGQCLTYEQLDSRVEQLASIVAEKTQPNNALVGLCADRSFEMVISILAILSAGKAYVPIDPALPDSRINYLLNDIQCDLVISYTDSVPDCVSSFKQHINLKQYKLEVTKSLACSVRMNDLAYVIYTSGSTGNPKGVMVEHKALQNRIDWMQKEYQLQTDDVVLQKTPYSFDVSVWEFIWPLVQGAKLLIAKPEGHKDPEYLGNLISTRKVSVLHFVPSMLTAFLDVNDAQFARSVRLLFCSGEALNIDDVFAVQKNASHVAMHNLYGPTEAAIDVSYFDCSNIKNHSEVPIGKPIQNTQLYILDDQLRVCPMGAEGQLFISGDCLARGYLNQDELTKNTFVEHPFIAGQRLYKTGDRACYLADGNIRYLGRLDEQVKIRGLRIELGEIQKTLANLPEVINSTVVVRSDLTGSNKIVAYVVANVKDTVKTSYVEGLSYQLRQILPEYMVPGVISLLDEIPLTHSGKVNKKLLPKPDLSGSIDQIISPATELETKLHKIWSDFLSVSTDKLSTDVSFFNLGGDSIAATRLVSRIKQELDIELPLTSIFEHRTIISLAAWLDSDSPKTSSMKIERLNREQSDEEESETGVF